MAFQSYLDLDGERAMICFTSKAEARKQTGCEAWDVAGIRDIMNNIFNKPVIGALLFNGYSEEKAVLVPKEFLNELIPGEKPLPPHFLMYEHYIGNVHKTMIRPHNGGVIFTKWFT